MKILLLITIIAASANVRAQWNPFSTMDQSSDTIKNFFEDQGQQMKTFFQDQKNKVEKVFQSGYESAVEVSDSVNGFFEDQQKKISEDINNYVEDMKEKSKKVGDSWSYLPSDDSSAKLENPEAVLTVPAIIARNGYPCETHTVMSKGYILNIHRIPRSRSSTNTSFKTVYLQHGIFASSADWILNGPEKSLAYALADAGYDVWMGNIRGNRYSKEHAFLKPDSKEYWNFSWHDVAKHDVPAIIDYIIKTKGQGTSITYIGHSMGTSILFAMLSLRPEYNNILRSAMALAPVVFTTEIKSPLKSLAPIASNIAYMEMLYGSHEFIPKQSALGKLSGSCDSSQDSIVCKNVIFYICGYDEAQFDKTRLPVFLSHLGTGTSWKTAVHFAQEIYAGGKFQQFDYGSSHNLRVYGTETPPEYDLSKITLPMTLFWSQNDLLSSEKDVMILYDKLPKKSTELYMVPFPEFNHLDYLIAKEAPKLLNAKLLETLKSTYRNRYGFKINFRKFGADVSTAFD